EMIAWREPLAERAPGDVVIEAFGCELPEAQLRRMAQRRDRPPVWINLEYLSAEDYVERSHALPSPQSSGPAAGLPKWFFYPGFTARTGGLLREPGLIDSRRSFDREAWLAERGWTRRPGERVISLFCYEQPALSAWLQQYAQQPTLLLATAGPAARQVEAVLGSSQTLGALRVKVVEPLPQPDYDRLLWSADLNIVRGEDSFVRAQWAGVPFVWHIYPQHDGAHRAKLEAFLDRFLAGGAVEPASHDAIRAQQRAWNEGAEPPALRPDAAAWHRGCTAWRDALCRQDDLTTQLLQFVAERR
ncbi:MAG TPA: elongation factor P maturation arginine rhamnosyltransferase EarP, partial [Burkholderiaceae bacterium]